ELPEGARLFHTQEQDHGLASALDNELIEAARPAIENGETIVVERTIRNVNRTVGTMLSGEIARRHGHAGLRPEQLRINFKGVAAADAGKGLSGGRVTVRQPAHVARDPAENIVVGNTVLYGAIAGEA